MDFITAGLFFIAGAECNMAEERAVVDCCHELWPFCRNVYVQKMITVVNLNIKMGIRVLAFSKAPNLRNKSPPVFYRTTQSF